MNQFIRYLTLFAILLAGMIALMVPTSTGFTTGGSPLPAPLLNGIKPTLS